MTSLPCGVDAMKGDDTEQRETGSSDPTDNRGAQVHDRSTAAISSSVLTHSPFTFPIED